MEMKYFYEFYEMLDRLGPGSRQTTLKALKHLPALESGAKTLDIGCGCGNQTLILAEQLDGEIIAVDNHQPFLDKLQKKLELEGLSDRVKTQAESMLELPFADQSFDLIWSEGAIYIMGFEQGLKSWRHLLKPGGLLAVSEATWFTSEPAEEIATYWQANYPAMQGVEANRKLIADCGYRLIDDFPIPASDWQEEYFAPQDEALVELRKRYPDIPEAEAVCAEIEQEIEMYRRHGDSYGYQFYLMKME